MFNMAIANRKELNDLVQKTQDEGTTDQGRLTAHEWNSLVDHVIDTKRMANGAIKGIKYNGGSESGGQTFTEIDKDGFLHMTVATGNSDYLFTPYLTEPPKIVANMSACPIELYVSSKKVNKDDNSRTPAELPSTVSIYINDILVHTEQVWDQEYGDTNSTWYDPLKSTLVKYDLASARNTSLLIGEDKLNSIKVQYNNGFGTVEFKYCTVSVIELGLTVNSFSSNTANNVFIDEENKLPNLIVTLSGSAANINAVVDGNNRLLINYPADQGYNNIGTQCFIDAGVNTHGVHNIVIWASLTKTIGGVDYPIETNRLSYTYIFGTKNEAAKPIIMSTFSNLSPEAYSTLDVSYIAYKYSNTNSVIKNKVYISLCTFNGYDSENNPIDVVTIGDTIENEITFDPATKSGTGSAKISLFPADGNQSSIIGPKLIKLEIDGFIQYTEIDIKKSTVTLTQYPGYAVYLTSAGKSNTQSNKAEWISTGKDITGDRITTDVTFNGVEFLPTGSGWNTDKDGNMALHLKKGKYATLNYAPFRYNPVYNDGSNNGNGRGKTISFELATRNCLKNDAPVISCLDNSTGTEIGFVVTASSAILKSNTFGLQAKFKENTRIKVDFVIGGTKHKYSYKTIMGKDATADDWEEDISEEALCIIYVDGVYQCLTVIPTGTTFKQGTSTVAAPFITFGSELCDVDIYNVRVYDQALVPIQIVNNYSYDTPKYEDKIAIARRNDIFENTDNASETYKPIINMGKLRDARPDLPFWTVKINKEKHDEIMPFDKTNWMYMSSTKWGNPINVDNPNGGAVSFTTDCGQFRNQGTSSMTYPWPWRNWDWKLKSGAFTFGDGSTDTKWCQYLGMDETENIKKITLKKDYASSEMCNNAITSEYFTDMALAIGGNSGFEGVLSPAQKGLGNKTPFRLTFKAIPCFMFQEFNDENTYGSAGKGFDALGMMNLIPNKNECGYLGFMGAHTWEENGSQSWELTDNMDDWFWYKEVGDIHNSTKLDDNGVEVKYVQNDVAKCYEARYPKDSTLNKDKEGKYGWNSDKDEADFGNIPDGYNELTTRQITEITREQADIKEFHNWLVSVNRQIPVDYAASNNGEYKKLSSNVAYNEVTYTHDTPEYRLAKFIAEAPTRLHIDQFCLYYIWRETFHAFDSGFKNLQLYTMGKASRELKYKQWGCMVRDADTTLGIENTGKDIFPPHLEDIDYYTADVNAETNDISNIKFEYGRARDVYHATTIKEQGGRPILNGQFGSLWINLRDGFPGRIAAIYKELKNNSKSNWNANAAIKRFRDHQEKWCENLYNFGMRQYFGGGPFTQWISSGLGDKKNSRASWLERAFYYRDSKYKCLNGSTDSCTLRAECYESPDVKTIVDDENETSTKVIPLKLKTYIPMYFAAGSPDVDMKNCTTIQRVIDTDNTFDVYPIEGFDFSGGDQNRVFFGSSQLTEIGDLARSIKINVIQSLNLPKVREFSIGHEKARTKNVPYNEYYTVKNDDGTETRAVREFTNTTLEGFDCSSLEQLTILDITNHKALKPDKFVNLNKCTQLQELYARGTDGLTSIELPATTSLRVIYLGKNLTKLELENLTGIEILEIEGYDKLEKLYIKNCGERMAAKSYEVVTSAIDSLSRVDIGPDSNICALEGINWENASVTILEKLLNINAALSGKINITDRLNNSLKVRLIEKYGDIDDEDNSLYITYDKLGIDDVSVQAKMYLYTQGKHELSFISTPVNANTFNNATWEITKFEGGNQEDYATVVYENNKWYLDVKQAATDASVSAKLKVTINQIGGYPSKTAESTVYFYERLAKPGDIVFNDGTFSDVLEAGKTPIGVCFYVDPNKKTNRLMCARDILTADGGYSNNGIPWGLAEGRLPGVRFDANSDGTFTSDDTCYDIDKLFNTSSGSGGTNNFNANWYKDNFYRSSETDENGDLKNDGFNQTSRTNVFGNIGWIKVGQTYDGSEPIDPITDGIDKDDNGNYRTPETVLNTNTEVPFGYYNTMAIIEHRNRLLTAYHWSHYGLNTENSGGVNTGNRTRYKIPKDINIEGSFTPEYENLNNLVSAATSWNCANNTGSQTGADLLYYPAASFCYAYEPDVANLNDKFKKHNWFLPSSGEMFRILYYTKWYNNTEDTDYDDSKAFIYTITTTYNDKPILDIARYGSSGYYSSTEKSSSGAISASYTSAQDYKYSGQNVLPICRF